LLDSWFGAVALSVPGTWYASLSTAAPTEAGTNFVEPVGNGYARVAITNNLSNFHQRHLEQKQMEQQ